MLATLKRLAALAPVVFLLLVLGAVPAYAGHADDLDGFTAAADPTDTTADETVDYSDTLTVQGDAETPTGTVSFAFFGTADCSGTPLFGGTATLAPVGPDRTSAATFTESFSVTTPGEYHWVATFPGDTFNNEESSDCTDAGQRVTVAPAAVVSKATPTLTGVADPQTVTEGQEVELTDTATLSGADTPTGTIFFALFDNDECDEDGLVFEDEAPIVGSTATFSDTFTPTDPGTYYWALFYEGDALNEEASSICDDPKQRLVVEPSALIVDPPGDDGGVEADGGGDPDVILAANGPGELPVTGPAPVSRLAQGALAVLMLGLAAMLMAGSPRRT